MKFGDRYLYKHCKKACKNLHIENVDLYGGSRHTTVTALGEYKPSEDTKAGTMHNTNKAFEHYFQGKARKAKALFSKRLNTAVIVTFFDPIKRVTAVSHYSESFGDILKIRS